MEGEVEVDSSIIIQLAVALDLLMGHGRVSKVLIPYKGKQQAKKSDG